MPLVANLSEQPLVRAALLRSMITQTILTHLNDHLRAAAAYGLPVRCFRFFVLIG